ncbi:MAG: energy transducer TonB [Rhodospirillaceae bacterium]|nr:energy transducer TonB [Rhodospirillaceae bacterium]
MKHSVVSALLILLGAGLALAQAPAPLTRVMPLYPLRALDRGIEGWVELSFTILPDGTTADIAVTDAYPKGTFDKPAKAALAKWTYAPADAPRPQMRVLMPFGLLSAGSVRGEVNDKITAALKAITDQRHAEADALLTELSKIEGLTLAEYALFERARGIARFSAGQHAEAAVSFERAMRLFGAKLNPEPRAAWARLLVMARVNAGQFADAVADFDQWGLAEASVAQDIAPTIAQIRTALAAGEDVSTDAASVSAGPPK